MEEVINSGTCPEFKDLEAKLGMKTPESLLRAMREDYTSNERALDTDEKLAMILPEELFEKIKNLKIQMEQLRSADVKILRQLLSLHEGMEMLRWLQGDRSTLTSLTSSLTGSQSSLGEVAAVTQEPGGDSGCCPNAPPETALGPCPSTSGSIQCSTSFEDSDEMSDQAWSAVSGTAKITTLQENGIADLTMLTSVPVSSQLSGQTQSRDADPSERAVCCAQEEPELSLGQSEALLGYDTHWCWVESKDDVTFL